MRIARRKLQFLQRIPNLLHASFCRCRLLKKVMISIIFVLSVLVSISCLIHIILTLHSINCVSNCTARSNELKSGQRSKMVKIKLDDEQEGADNVWIRISDEVHLYSAYLDLRPIKTKFLIKNNSQYVLVRMIGLLKVPPMRQVIKEDPFKWLRIKDEAGLTTQFKCKVFIYLQNGQKLVLSEGNILTRFIFEEGIKVFAGTFFNCYVNVENIKERRVLITRESSIVYVVMSPVNVTGYPDKLIRVMNINQENDLSQETSATIKLSVCIRPLFGVDNLSRLTQFISYYRLMGVESFNFYDLSISPEVRKYLTAMTGDDDDDDEGINVSLRKWNLPTGNSSELWDFGSLAALNDCLYWNMARKRPGGHVLFVDIDEFIVPQGKAHNNMDLIKLIGMNERFHELKIRNTFFCKEFCKDGNSGNAEDTGSSYDITKCFIRTKRIWSAQLRTKFIVKPKTVLSVGHHMVTKFAQNYDNKKDPLYMAKYSKVLSKDLALMNHYRECISLGDTKTLTRKCVKDTTILELIQKKGNMKLFQKTSLTR